MGFLPGGDLWVERAVEQLKRRRDETRLGREQPPKRPTWPGVSGPAVPVPARREGPSVTVAAERWKAQVNENVKRLAFAATQPELCHNEVCGWAESSKQVAAGMCLVTLRNDSEHPQVGWRFDIVSDIIRPWVSDVIEVRAQGDGDLAQLFDLTYFGDYVSLWLAADAGIDPPDPRPHVDEAPARRADRPSGWHRRAVAKDQVRRAVPRPGLIAAVQGVDGPDSALPSLR